MSNLSSQKSKKSGLSPGSLVYIGDRALERVRITIFNYNAERYEEITVDRVEECVEHLREPTLLTWVLVEGLSDPQVIEQFGKVFGIHALWLEDALNTHHRPKSEELDDLLFVILKAVRTGEKKPSDVVYEHMSLFLGERFVVTFVDGETDAFEGLKERIRQGKGKIRHSDADYLYYALIDSAVDTYYAVLEAIGSEIEKLDTSVMMDQRSNGAGKTSAPKRIHRLRNTLLYLRRAAVPLRSAVRLLCQEEHGLAPKTMLYLKDVHQHAVQIVETIDTYRELLSGLLDLHVGLQNQRMNEIIKVLTIFMAIFIPLSFVAGIYGMNFRHMPELEWVMGYPMALGIMAVVAAGLLVYFRRKKWI